VTGTIYGADYEAQFLGADALDSSLTLAMFIKDGQLVTKFNPSIAINPGVNRTTESGAFGFNDYEDVFV
jgi:hypothetical protein